MALHKQPGHAVDPRDPVAVANGMFKHKGSHQCSTEHSMQ